jgi:pyruvate/2-oxoglutarate dehydrogenase complex dihydrolipoamide dehydrogenase (E3) component
LPTKSLLESAHAYDRARHDERFSRGALPLDYPRVLAERKTAMARFTARVTETQLATEGITYFHGKVGFLSAHDLRVGERTVHAAHLVLAVGARPVIPPIPGLDTVKYLTYMHAINLPYVPPSLLIIGGGPVGCEFAQIFRRFGAEVTIVERFPGLLNQEDVDVSSLARQVLEADGVRILTEATVTEVHAADGKKVVTVTTANGAESLVADEVLVVTGRRPHLEDLNLAATGMRLERGCPVLRDSLQTSIPHIWVCGDAAGRLQFKHLAEYQGTHVGNNIASPAPAAIDERVIPHATFLDPEIASVGLTEAQARAQEDPIIVTLPLERSDRAQLLQQSRGFLKLIVRRRDGQILGGHLAGPFAGDMIHEIALAMRAQVPVAMLAALPRVYPSLYAPLGELALAAQAQCMAT